MELHFNSAKGSLSKKNSIIKLDFFSRYRDYQLLTEWQLEKKEHVNISRFASNNNGSHLCLVVFTFSYDLHVY